MPGMVPGDERTREALQPLMGMGRQRDMIHIRDANGTPIELPTNADQDPLPLSEDGLTHLQRGEVWVEFNEDEEGRILIYNRPVVVKGELLGIIQLSRSLADRDRSLQFLSIVLIGGGLLVLKDVKADCGCTVPSLTTMQLGPGELAGFGEQCRRQTGAGGCDRHESLALVVGEQRVEARANVLDQAALEEEGLPFSLAVKSGIAGVTG